MYYRGNVRGPCMIKVSDSQPNIDESHLFIFIQLRVKGTTDESRTHIEKFQVQIKMYLCFH